jgi:hypothetical protein
MTPPKLMPPFHSAAARGTLPTEQTKLMNARTGPTMTFSIADHIPCPVRNRAFQTPVGTATEANPATTKPITSSLRSIVTSLIV